jgi:acyl-CoA thioesterase-1
MNYARQVETLARSELVEQNITGQRRLVLALGDSLYAGYRLAGSDSFPAALERALDALGVGAEVVNAGVSGNTTSDGLRRLRPALDRLHRKPDLVLIGLGANDAFQGVGPEQARRNLETMILELQRRDICVMLTGITAPSGWQHPFFTRYEAIYPELAARHGLAVETSFLKGVMTRRDMLLPDGLHPNAAGVAKMAEWVAPQIAALLQS